MIFPAVPITLPTKLPTPSKSGSLTSGREQDMARNVYAKRWQWVKGFTYRPIRFVISCGEQKKWTQRKKEHPDASGLSRQVGMGRDRAI